MKFGPGILVALLAAIAVATAQGEPGARVKTEFEIVYTAPDGHPQTLNAFLPQDAHTPTPAMVDIHGGWWHAGEPLKEPPGEFLGKGIAVFSIHYRLGRDGGFPENIRDCRNAVRFIRKNARRFNVDPDRIGVTGGSAGGHLSLMVAMVPEDFADGGPTAGLEGISARVSCAFSYIAPTDFIRFWAQGPEDVSQNPDGTEHFRPASEAVPNDSRPRLRVLFHGETPDTETHRQNYRQMCPMGHVRRDVPPLLICDGEQDPVVPGLHGRALCESLQAAGVDATYWMSPGGGHGYPSGTGFQGVRDSFLARTLKLDAAK